MRVFVTGGLGFIGSHVVDRLIEEGNSVTIFDNLSSGKEKFLNKNARFIKGDLKDMENLKKVIARHDSVIHMAAEISIKDSIENPKDFLEKNIGYIINLLEAMRENDIKNIVFSSSAAVYGETGDRSAREDDPKLPIQAYGASKVAGEAIISAYCNSFKMNSVCLRYFNVYGPRDEVEPVTRAVPNWIKSSIKKKPLTLYWEGKQIKDYIFVKDVAIAHLVALENCRGIRVYNIGSGEGNPMTDILKSVVKASGEEQEVINLGERKGDPHRLVADISRIKEELGWEPQYALDQGISETFDYYKENIKG